MTKKAKAKKLTQHEREIRRRQLAIDRLRRAIDQTWESAGAQVAAYRRRLRVARALLKAAEEGSI